MAESNLSHLPDFYNHLETERSKSPRWEDGSDIPWMTYPAISYLMQIDLKDKNVFEYGAGSSTSFWSSRAKRVISVEHDREWFQKIEAEKISNVEIFCAKGAEYIERIKYKSPHDIISIDGRWRFDCVHQALHHLSFDGMIILDNSERYPVATEFLRKHGLLQVDMVGYGPQNRYIWSTTLFFSRQFNAGPLRDIQPHQGPGMTDSIECKPHYWKGNEQGSYL